NPFSSTQGMQRPGGAGPGQLPLRAPGAREGERDGRMPRPGGVPGAPRPNPQMMPKQSSPILGRDDAQPGRGGVGTPGGTRTGGRPAPAGRSGGRPAGFPAPGMPSTGPAGGGGPGSGGGGAGGWAP